MYVENVSITCGLLCAGKARKWQQVLDVFAEMRECGVKPDVFTYSSLIKACQSCGNRWMQALNFLEQMRKEGENPYHAAICNN